MANANYTLTLGANIDTVLVLEIGGKYANVNKLTGTIKNVFINEGGIRIRLEVGGSENAPYELVVTVDQGDKTLETVPKSIKGKVGRSGGAIFDRTCPLK